MKKIGFLTFLLLTALVVTAIFHATQLSFISYSQGRALFKDNRFAEAIPYFEKAIAANDSNVRAEREAGYAYLWTGRPERAVLFFKKALWLDPSDLKIKESLADAYVWSKQYEEAIQLYKELLRIKPGPLLYKKLADALNYSGNHPQAIRIYQKVLGDLKNQSSEERS